MLTRSEEFQRVGYSEDVFHVHFPLPQTMSEHPAHVVQFTDTADLSQISMYDRKTFINVVGFNGILCIAEKCQVYCMNILLPRLE